MTGPSRRHLLMASGALGASWALGACNTAPKSDKGAGGADGPITWWDHTPNLQEANKKSFKAYEKKTGIPVEYSYHQTAKMGQALQLAKQSKQLPDIHTISGLGKLPPRSLVESGWFQPIDIGEEAVARVPKGTIQDGIHRFDGKLYTVPIFDSRQYWAATWFNKEMMAKADVEPPTTYDAFRAVARKIQNTAGDGTYGWIFNLNQPPRLAEVVNFLAQGPGFPGWDGELFKTGEYAYHHDAYVTVIEFLLSMQQDKLLFPGSSTLDDKTGRVKWAAGAAGMYIDGPWCTGTLKVDGPEFLPKVDVAPMLVPEAGMKVQAHREWQQGMFWMSTACDRPKQANELLAYLTSQTYYRDVANGMAQPPVDLSVVEKADVHPAWRKLIGWYQEQAFIAPMAVLQNPEIAKVQAEDQGVKPMLGDLIQGLFSGQVKGVRRTLKDLSDRSAKNREKNLAAAKKKGAKVEESDWAFPDWEPGKDYTQEMYKT